MFLQRIRYGWVLLLLSTTLLVACETPTTATTSVRPTLVLLVADGLRSDRVRADPLGPSATGVVSFERAYAPSSLAEQSLSATFTGRLPTYGGSIGLAEAQPADAALTLATRLRRAGYTSALVSQASWAARPGFTRGFDDVQVAPVEGWSSAEIVQRALRAADDRLASGDDAPFFLVAHWRAPVLTGTGTEAVQDPGTLGAEYERRITETMRSIDELLAGLEERGLLENAVVTLTAGHGFELLEHGGVGSGWTLDEEVVRVPLVLGVFGAQAQPLDVSPASPVSTLRLYDALLQLAGDPDTESATGGAGEAAPVVSELVVRERAILRAVIDGDTKYLRVLREIPPADREVVARGYEEIQAAMLGGSIETPPLFGDPLREALFRLEGGGGLGTVELRLAEHTDALSRLRAVLRDYQRRCETDGFVPPQITDRLPIDPSDAEDLEMLGYL